MKKILFIEDEQSLNEAYRSKFASKYEVDFAMDGESGLQKAINEKPDLIVLDILMPGEVNGIGVLKKIKENPYTFSIPVLVLTNLQDQEQTVIELGAEDCLVKANTSFETVEEKVATLISRQD